MTAHVNLNRNQIEAVLVAAEASRVERCTLVDEYFAERTALVTPRGWRSPDPDGDVDRFDKSGCDTTYVLMRRSGRLTVGVRVTRLKSLSESLSLDMWAPALTGGMSGDQDFNSWVTLSTQLDGAARRGLLCDVTRLVAAGTNDAAVRVLDVLAAFGAACGVIGYDGWGIYTTTQAVAHFLDRVGIPSITVLAERLDPRDEEESLLRVSSISEVVSLMTTRSHRFSAHFLDGYHQADARVPLASP